MGIKEDHKLKQLKEKAPKKYFE